jgi:hypothetical protein
MCLDAAHCKWNQLIVAISLHVHMTIAHHTSKYVDITIKV